MQSAQILCTVEESCVSDCLKYGAALSKNSPAKWLHLLLIEIQAHSASKIIYYLSAAPLRASVSSGDAAEKVLFVGTVSVCKTDEYGKQYDGGTAEGRQSDDVSQNRADSASGEKEEDHRAVRFYLAGGSDVPVADVFG